VGGSSAAQVPLADVLFHGDAGEDGDALSAAYQVLYELRAAGLQDDGEVHAFLLRFAHDRGVIAVVVTVWARRGLWGVVVKRWHVHHFPTQRRLELAAASPGGRAGHEPLADLVSDLPGSADIESGSP
jgi:hypothetical protein